MPAFRPAAACFLLLVISCASAPQPLSAPSRAVQRLVRAVRSDNPARLYALLSDEARESIDRERFEALWLQNRAELLDLAEALERTTAKPEAYARQSLAGDERVVLVLEQGRWYVEGGVLDAVALRTPLDAVAALRRALQRRDLESFLHLLSRSRRLAWQATLDAVIEQTGDPLDMEVEIQGDRATVRTTGGTVIHLLQEAGRWKVSDLE